MLRKVFSCLALVGVACFGGNVHAGILFDADGTGGSIGAKEINQFDYSPGNGLAVGGITAISNFISGSGSTDFDFFFQTTIAGAKLEPNATNVIAGFAGELTVVGGLTETVTDAGTIFSSGVARFGDAASQTVNYFEIYYDETPDANALAGTGFNDGTLILSGEISTIDPNTSSNQFSTDLDPPYQDLDGFTANGNNYPGEISATGSGNSFIGLEVTTISWDADFFPYLTEFFKFDFNTGLRIPFTSVDPSAMFLTGTTTTAVGAAPVSAGVGSGSIGAVNGISGPDFQVQIDPNGTINGRMVPEPGSFAIFAGLIGVAGLSRRRRR